MNKLETIKLKAKWAKEHIRHLEMLIASFLNGNPYRIGFKDDVNAGQRTLYVEKVTDVPWPILTCAGDVIQNLRSSLDHLAYELVCIGKQSRGPFTRVEFPIAGDPKQFEADLLRKVDGARKDAHDAIRAVEPYKGGNNLIWQLHELNRIDKHRLLLAAAISHLGYRPNPTQREYITKLFQGWFPRANPNIVAGMYFPTDTKFPLKEGDVIDTIPISESEQYMDFRFDIAFNESGIVEREPVLATLGVMADAVNDTLDRFTSLL